MNAVPVTLPGTPLVAMLLTGAANLLPAATCMFMALMGGNGVALGGTALALLAGWVAGLVMARHLARKSWRRFTVRSADSTASPRWS